MPCRCEGYSRTEYYTATNEIDSLTQMLCYACGNFIAFGLSMPTELYNWWKIHEEADWERVTKAMQDYISNMSTTAVKKLTVDKLANSFIKKAEAVHPVSDWHKGHWFPKIAANVLNKNLVEVELRERALAKLTEAERKALKL
ncbi:MAG: hypothetical protein WDA42_07785 [Candidatus Bathyarchaeia archaeon]